MATGDNSSKHFDPAVVGTSKPELKLRQKHLVKNVFRLFVSDQNKLSKHELGVSVDGQIVHTKIVDGVGDDGEPVKQRQCEVLRVGKLSVSG